jgi:hypothetical protein
MRGGRFFKRDKQRHSAAAALRPDGSGLGPESGEYCPFRRSRAAWRCSSPVGHGPAPVAPLPYSTAVALHPPGGRSWGWQLAAPLHASCLSRWVVCCLWRVAGEGRRAMRPASEEVGLGAGGG